MKREITLLTMLLAGIYATDASASGAKALFYDEGDVSVQTSTKTKKKPAQKKKNKETAQNYLGISYWVDLVEPDGKVSRTTASRTFRSGDRIKLNLQANRNGYLYVVGVGSSGASRVLFPNAEGVANGIKAKITYAVPFDSSLKFDNLPGEETLLVMLSEKPMPELAPGTKSIPEQETRQMLADAHVPGAKDLVIEEEVGEAAPLPASYAVAPVQALGKKKVLTLQIKLKHE